MSILGVVGLIWIHFLSDFIFQTDEVAINKSKSVKVLCKHVGYYGIPFLIYGIDFTVINMFLHFITDFVTSKIASHYYKTEKRHKFFLTIGADQAIHMTCLLVTYYYL